MKQARDPDVPGPDPAGQRRLAEIVLHAAALETGERDAYLEGLQDEDPELLAEAHRRLSAAAELTRSFLAAPAGRLFETETGESAAGASGEDEPPETPPLLPAERYERRELLGEGGMARVFLAHDRQLGRQVALKLLEHPDPAMRRRFLHEARAQARVRHDNVLEVYETGEWDGTPYIAMRYVEGKTLLAVRDDTSLEEKVRLLARVAEGLHAAHREGLLHRDVKPSNVLVEETPDGWKPWVADFGIAVAEEPGAAEDAMGTPFYMAPERLRRGAVVDRRTDVYSLGVTMYQLFSGELPFASDSTLEGVRSILDDEPRPLAERLPGLPADLEAIVMKCLARDPEARYPSAQAVALDLRRFLDGEVVEAHAASVAYRLARFALRHRLALVVAAVAAVLLVGALAVAAFLGVRAVEASAEARDRRDQAETLLGFMLGDLREKLEGVGRLEILDEVGEKALAYFAALPEAKLDEAELARRSTALYQIGEIRIHQGRPEAALGPLRESLKLARRLAEDHPGSGERLFDLGQSLFWAGFGLWKQGELEEAEAAFNDYLRISERLVALDPENLDWRLELSYAHSNLGSVAQEKGEYEEARRRFEKALELNREVVEKDPGNDAWRLDLAAAHNALGVVLRSLGRPDEAREHYLAELAIKKALVEADPDHAQRKEQLGTCYDYLGGLALDSNALEEAAGYLEAARQIFDELTAFDPENATWKYKLALACGKLGEARHRHGETDAALPLWRREQAIMESLTARDPKNSDWRRLLAISYYHLAHAYRTAKDPDGVEASLRRSLAILEEVAAERPEEHLTQQFLARVRAALERSERDPN